MPERGIMETGRIIIISQEVFKKGLLKNCVRHRWLSNYNRSEYLYYRSEIYGFSNSRKLLMKVWRVFLAEGTEVDH
mgnify:CR=1 FL=1